MSDAIVTHKLTKFYDGRAVVNSLDLRVPQGTVYGFLGRNGAGKSTTIKMLLGMVHPDVGRSELLDEDSQSLRPETRARIGYLAEGHPLYRWMTVGEAVRFSRAFYEKWNDDLLAKILDHFGISLKAKIKRLSNGQRAQVALALVVATDPELLILDDPTLGLDTVVRRDFLESMIQIIQRKGRTILFSSHILNDVERVADRIGILVDGVLRVDCTTERFKNAVRRLVVEFPSEAPEIPAIPGLIGAERTGCKAELIVVDYDEAKRETLEKLKPLAIEEIEMNLEDAFISYTRGPRKPLAIFADAE